ncbi:hypothetical protein VNO80_22403 [Phaseolus coccineus]|uniref:glycerol-3-phosphate dehydrogenase n=1 Tax=Phaseolus coccineus TaxID=3886 RepID=A0AAN9M517_PHACN
MVLSIPSFKYIFLMQNENLGKRLAHDYPFLEAEVAYCARHEYCESAIDFISRRSRLAFLDTDAAGRALSRVIQILGSEHKWDKTRQKQQMLKAKEFWRLLNPKKMLNSMMGSIIIVAVGVEEHDVIVW